MKGVTRTLSFFSKWTAEIVRQPALMLWLVIGPFLVLLAFGQGVDLEGPHPRIMVVRPEGPEEELQPLPEELSQHVTVVGETTDLEAARRKLRDGDVDGIAVLPENPEATVRSGQQVPLRVLTDEIDPVRKSYAKAYLSDQVATLNRKTVEKAIADAQSSVKDLQAYIGEARGYVSTARSAQGSLDATREQVRNIKGVIDPLANASDRVADAVDGVAFVVPGLGNTQENADRLRGLVGDLRTSVNSLDAQVNGTATQPSSLPSDQDLADLDAKLADVEKTAADVVNIPPEVLSAPFKLQLENIAPFVPTFAGFYAPAVLALLLQHLAITLGALSLAKIRILGLMDILRTSPVRAIEVVNGNYLSYGALCIVAAAALVTLVVTLLDVPIFGSYWVLALGIVLLIATSLGIGFVISLLSSSEQQAAQVAMLVLLCSIFFSGFVFGLDRVGWPVRALSYALPTTYAIRSFQDVMLRGVVREPLDFVVLGGIAAMFFTLTFWLFRREFRTV